MLMLFEMWVAALSVHIKFRNGYIGKAYVIIILSTILVGFLFVSMFIFCISVYIVFICMGNYRLFIISPFCSV